MPNMTGLGIPWTWYRSISGLRPEMGRKWPKNGFWPHLKNGGNMAQKIGKMARNSIFEPFSGHFFHFPGHFSHFPGHFSPFFSRGQNPCFGHFHPHFGPEARNGSIPGPPDSKTGRQGYWTMEMNGGSSAPYLACTPCVPLFVHCLLRVKAEER